MVQYDNVDSAKEALSSVKGTFIKNSRRLMVRYTYLVIDFSSLLVFTTTD